jgi:hypothetical protein
VRLLNSLVRQVEDKIKAVVATVLSALAVYVAEAVLTHEPLTLDGLKLAVMTAVLTGYGVYRSPANKTKSAK